MNRSANEEVVSLARADTKDMLEQLVRHKQSNLKHFENEPKITPPLSSRLVKLLAQYFTTRVDYVDVKHNKVSWSCAFSNSSGALFKGT